MSWVKMWFIWGRQHWWLGTRRQRVERACVLLHATGNSIEQIAEATGFCDRYHFTRVFTRLRGVSPAAFRKTLTTPRGRA